MNTLTDQELQSIRAQFPALERYAYFTTNGLGVLPQRSVEALRQQLEGLSANAIVATLFQNGPLLDAARQRVASLLGADADEIAFCRNTSEGVLWMAQGIPVGRGDEVLCVQGEYPANVLPWMAQAARGVTTRLLRQQRRRLTPEMVAAAWGPQTRVLAVSFVQYNSGFRADLEGLARVVHERSGLLFCDAIQGLGALRLDVRQTGVDALAAGTHKWLLGVQGLGVFYCRRGLLPDLGRTHVATGSLVHDGDPEDPEAPYALEVVEAARRFEEGSRNYLGIAALNESLQLIEGIGIDRIEARIRILTDYVVEEMTRRGCRIESPRGPGEWSGILLIAPPPGAPPATDIVAAMHGRRITINAREGCLHLGVHFYNTRDDIDRMLGVFDDAVAPARPEPAPGSRGG
jgi:cysteine desulfurase/selenocysteine lyase